jgi:hypothetical protein
MGVNAAGSNGGSDRTSFLPQACTAAGPLIAAADKGMKGNEEAESGAKPNFGPQNKNGNGGKLDLQDS